MKAFTGLLVLSSGAISATVVANVAVVSAATLVAPAAVATIAATTLGAAIAAVGVAAYRKFSGTTDTRAKEIVEVVATTAAIAPLQVLLFLSLIEALSLFTMAAASVAAQYLLAQGVLVAVQVAPTVAFATVVLAVSGALFIADGAMKWKL